MNNYLLTALLIAGPIIMYQQERYGALFLILGIYFVNFLMLCYFVGRGEIVLNKKKNKI